MLADIGWATAADAVTVPTQRSWPGAAFAKWELSPEQNEIVDVRPSRGMKPGDAVLGSYRTPKVGGQGATTRAIAIKQRERWRVAQCAQSAAISEHGPET
jgi:hypothetical protein